MDYWIQSNVAVAFPLQKVPPDLRAGRQAAGGRGWRGRGWLPALRAAADRGRAPVPGAVPRGARDSLRHQVRQRPGHVRSRATCPGTRQSAGRRTAACARPATPPRASTASPWTAGPSTARWGTCHIYYIIHVHVSHILHCTRVPGVHRGEHGAVLHCRGVRPGGGHQLRVPAQGGVRGGARAGLQVTRAGTRDT